MSNNKNITTLCDKWSHEMAYFLGYFAADGNISSCGNKSISFESKDYSLLTNIKTLLDIGPDIKKYSTTYLYRVGSSQLYDRLVECGMSENKSLTLQYPIIPDEYIWSFIRGVFDGDGWITHTTKNTQFGICSASLHFITGIYNQIKLWLGDKVVIRQKSTAKNIIYEVIVVDKRSLSLLFQNLYLHSTSVTRLDRKFEKFQNIKKIDCYFIPPVSALRFIDNGNYTVFCLAHLYLKYPKYREFFLNLRRTSKRPKYITLDNSAAERSLVTTNKLLDIVAELQPDEVISPDILFNKQQTIDNLEDFVNHMEKRNLLNNTKIFGCPQGTTQAEWLECYEYMINHPKVSIIGLSKIAVPKCWLDKTDDEGIKEARNICVQYLIDHSLIKKQLHLLGMGDPTEYIKYNHILIRSTDSCYTVWAAMNNINLKVDEFVRIPTPHDYFERKVPRNIDQLVRDNMKYLRENLK